MSLRRAVGGLGGTVCNSFPKNYRAISQPTGFETGQAAISGGLFCCTYEEPGETPFEPYIEVGVSSPGRRWFAVGSERSG